MLVFSRIVHGLSDGDGSIIKTNFYGAHWSPNKAENGTLGAKS